MYSLFLKIKKLLLLSVSMFIVCFLVGMKKISSKKVDLIKAHSTSFSPDSIPNLQNGLAKTPPMGWNSWNAFHTHINERQIKEVANAMVNDGMEAAGYKYLIIDDAWLGMHRNKKGRIIGNPKRFPDGIKALADYIHSKGLKFGIYESPGIKTCAGYPGSLHHEKEDAETFANWGVDYLKFDDCFKNRYRTNYMDRYVRMEKYLLATKRPIVLSIHTPSVNMRVPVNKRPWQWAPKIANMWRTTSDIQDNWNSVMQKLDQQVGLYKYAGPGHWNDPDMLEVGNGGMTKTEYKAHFSIWAILAAPLIAGTDLRHMSDQTKAILENKDVIAVDQDPAGIEGHKALDNGNQEVWVKPMQDGSETVLLLNRGPKRAFMTITAEQAGLKKATYYKMKNLWSHKYKRTDELIRGYVPSHGVAMYRVWPESN
ncbi:MAG TPA: glycoside hydrolase family 27 protein [Balneolales bacterium]|nr:glycoside hydrolase family 27 protein [Balneolales bacterium]